MPFFAVRNKLSPAIKNALDGADEVVVGVAVVVVVVEVAVVALVDDVGVEVDDVATAVVCIDAVAVV